MDKLRGSDFMSGYIPCASPPTGCAFPTSDRGHRGTSLIQGMLSSGNGALDALLGGGLESGTTTVITGPTGSGKSTIGMQFLKQTVTPDRRGILYAFEESAEAILARSRGMDTPLTQLLKGGALKIVPVNPLELYPDEFLSLVRTGVEQDGCRIVMIDSLQGHQLAMEEFGTMVANIRNLTTYLNRHGITTLLEAVRGGSFGQGNILSRVVPNVVFTGDFDTQQFALRLARKDVGLATELAREFDVPMALISLVEQLMVESVARGWGERDSNASWELQEERAGVKVRASK